MIARIYTGLERTLRRISKLQLQFLQTYKQHKLRFDEECLGFLDQMMQVKTLWLQDPNQAMSII
jgi:hypothetical protein